MSDVTRILERAQAGDPQAADRLLPLVLLMVHCMFPRNEEWLARLGVGASLPGGQWFQIAITMASRPSPLLPRPGSWAHPAPEP